MKTKVIVILFFMLMGATTTTNAQLIPESYQGMFDEIVENFTVIRGATSLNEGKNSLRLLSNEKIVIRMDHKKSIKTVTFVKALDEEGNKYWISDNTLTTDMVNKYEDDLTEVVEDMLELSREKAKK